MPFLPKKNKIEHYHLHENQPDKNQFELYSLAEYLIDSEGCANQPHVHSFYQIIWFTEGDGKHFVDFNEYDFSENCIFFIPKGQIHYFDKSLCNGYIIHFNEIFLLDDENDTNIFLKHSIFNSFENEPFFRIKQNQTENLLYIINQMQNEIALPDRFAYKSCLKYLLNLFLISIQRIGERNSCKQLLINNPYHIVFVRFRQLLETNYRKIHTVNEYADLLNISGKTLTNYTKAISQQTPLDIINERIILEAKRLLTHSGLSVNEIAFDLGFEDPSYFVKFFKRYTKMSPREFKLAVS